MFNFKPLNPFEIKGIARLFKTKHMLDCVAGLRQECDSIFVRR